MMYPALHPEGFVPMSVEDFRAFEAERPHERWELVDFEPRMMAGGSARHATISGNIQASLRTKLRGTGCQVFQSDMRVELAANGFAAYPDVVVRCGANPLDRETFITDPTVLFEVLSPTSALRDLSLKPVFYQAFESLQSCVAVWSAERRIMILTRDPNELLGWREDTLIPDETIAPPGLPATMSFAEVYEGVTDFAR
jgi:Uma2 family endonuclease